MIGIFSAAAIAGGLLVGRWVAARLQRKPLGEGESREATRPSLADGDGGAGAAERDEHEPRRNRTPPAHAIDWRMFPCALGDVVLRTLDGAEAWLAGAIVLREDAPAAVLFIAPDAGGERAVYVRPRPSEEIAWLAPVSRDAAPVGAEPPSTLEIEGVRFERRRRLPLSAERWGTGTPEVQGVAIVGEYATPSGEVAVVLISDGVSHAWRGRRLQPGEFEVWNGEKTAS